MTSKTGRRIHLAAMLFWASQLVLVWFMPASWRVPYLVIVSIYANFVGHWGAYSAERPTEIEEPDDS